MNYFLRYRKLTPELRASLAAGRCCVICGKRAFLVIDHCHRTGLIRDVLCFGCNIALGQFQDHIGLLKRAIAYLQFFEEQHRVNLHDASGLQKDLC